MRHGLRLPTVPAQSCGAGRRRAVHADTGRLVSCLSNPRVTQAWNHRCTPDTTALALVHGAIHAQARESSGQIEVTADALTCLLPSLLTRVPVGRRSFLGSRWLHLDRTPAVTLMKDPKMPKVLMPTHVSSRAAYMPGPASRSYKVRGTVSIPSFQAFGQLGHASIARSDITWPVLQVTTRHGRALTSYYARWIERDLSQWKQTLISRVRASTPEARHPCFDSPHLC